LLPFSSVDDAAAVAASLKTPNDGTMYGEFEDFGVNDNHHLYEKHDKVKMIVRRQVPPEQESIICAQYIVPW
jgi:hypothetical protein